MIKFVLLDDKISVLNGHTFVSGKAVDKLNELSLEYDIVSISHSKYTVGNMILNSVLVGYVE